jgi:hypothetical protein
MIGACCTGQLSLGNVHNLTGGGSVVVKASKVWKEERRNGRCPAFFQISSLYW